jgi:hypothetical protein
MSSQQEKRVNILEGSSTTSLTDDDYILPSGKTINDLKQERKATTPPQRSGAGAVINDRVTMCKYCKKNGFPNEPIAFIREKGKCYPVNFFDGNPHQHKSRIEQQIDTRRH